MFSQNTGGTRGQLELTKLFLPIEPKVTDDDNNLANPVHGAVSGEHSYREQGMRLTWQPRTAQKPLDCPLNHLQIAH